MGGRGLVEASGGARPARGILAGVIAVYLLIVVAQASLKLVWGDELITFYIARHGGLEGIWSALRAGADPNPPLTHVVVMLATRCCGVSSLAMRLPSILFVGLALAAMWTMLRRWVSPMYAAAGLLAFMGTRGFDYAYDARSYAPMMGLAMTSLALWMALDDLKGWRFWAGIGGMTLALAGGISSNYYCVIAYFPITVGELVRSRRQGRIRSAVWLGMAVSSLPLLVYLPLIRKNVAEFGPHAWNQPHVSMIGLSYFELVEGMFWPVAALAGFAWWKRRQRSWRISAEEGAALGVLLAYPLIGFAIASGGAGMISPRCVAPVCCGFGLVLGLLAAGVFGGNRRAQMALVGFLLVWVMVREGICAEILLGQRRAFLTLRDQVDAAEAKTGDPILVADSSFVLPLYFYSTREVRSHLFVPIDFPEIHRVEKDDSGEENLWGGRDGVFPFRIETFEQAPGAPLLLIGRPDGWLAQMLERSGVKLEVVDSGAEWGEVGGVFTPMAHPESRLLEAR